MKKTNLIYLKKGKKRKKETKKEKEKLVGLDQKGRRKNDPKIPGLKDNMNSAPIIH